ncbi:separin [Chiroxiphia lanceolata]|uniref:separin n=1 Tax=Chiroxiphia lanceolata TaxID=296741 RepID=UPI0013CE5195|nr:separin [Chiroxiphia lanceolata]XP_032569432.1 separin [Chiroxiphia lanceolata]
MDGKEKGANIEERLEKLRESLQIPPGAPPPSRQRRLQTCDRVLRSCVEQLGREGPPSFGPPLVALAQEAARGYLSVVPNPPGLYLEKILFHLLRNAVNSCWRTGNSCWAAAELLRERLRTYTPLQDPPKDFTTVTYNTFCVLWKGAAALAGPDRPREEGRSLFSAQIRALRFLLLLERDGGSLPPLQPPFFTSQTAQKAAAASALYEAERAPCPVFLARQLREFLLETLREEAPNPPGIQHSLCFLELTLECSRHLCRAGRFHEALEALEEAKAFLGCSREDLGAPLALLEAGIQLGKGRSPPGPLLSQAAAVLRGEGSERTLRVLLEGARFVTAQLGEVTRRSRELPFGLEDLPGLCAFTEGHCWALQRLLGRVPPDALKQQVTVKQLLFRSLQLFSNTIHDTFQGSQPSGWLGLAQVSRTCTRSVTWMVEALRGLPETDRAKFLDVTASCTFKLGFAFQSRNFLEEAGTICEPFCRGVVELGGYSCPDTPPERLHKCFRMQVESWKRLGRTEQALGSVTTWLLALTQPGGPLVQPGGVLRAQPGGLLHEPVGLWARIKSEAAKQGQEELRLRTLRDSLEGHSLDKATLVSLLLAELQAYKCLKWDTGPERYNVLCDLLELCPEDPGGLLPRALGLLELAQVLCYHSFAPHTDCSALDAIREALRLLEKVPQNSQNRDQLLDEKAQALLWLHICTLEAHMEKGMEREQRGRTQGSRNLEEFEPNDLNAEGRAGEELDPQDGISCTLDTDRALTKSLDEAFSLWKQLLESPGIPCVRSLEQTVTSLHLLATLYKLLAKPIQALESFLLLRSLCRSLSDTPGAAWALSHLTRLLLQLECPTHAQVFLEELESILREFPGGDESQQLLQHSCLLLRSHLCCVSQKMEEGLSLLLQVLQSPLAQKATKGWYLLQAQGLQVVATYLGMAPAHLDPELRHRLHRKGWKTPKVALMEVQKLLRSVIIFLLGFDILGGSRSNEGAEQFQDYGANVVLKWEVLGEALWCCERLVTLLGRAEVLCRARAFCGEALRLSGLLQGTRWCTSFLLLKSQLELQQGELELSQLNLQHTLFLLQPHPELKAPQEPLLPPKIHPRKGHMEPRRRWDHPKNPSGEEDEGFLKGPALEFVAPSSSQDPLSALTASPELKPGKKMSLAFLSHPWSCPCCLCSDLVVSVLGLRWALAQARGRVLAGEGATGVALVRRVLPRCARVGHRFARELSDRLGGHHGKGEPPGDRDHPGNQNCSGTGDPTRDRDPLGNQDLGLQDPCEDQDPAENWDLPTLDPQNPPRTRPQPTLGLLDELVAMGYSTLALQSLSSAGGLWDPQDEELEWGLTFLGSCSPHLPGLGVSRATLLLAKAMATLGHLATKLGLSVDDVLAQGWTLQLQPPPQKKTLKDSKAEPQKHKPAPPKARGVKPRGVEPPKEKPSKEKPPRVKPPRVSPPSPQDVFSPGDLDSEVVPPIAIRGPCTPHPKAFPSFPGLPSLPRTPFTIYNEASPPPCKAQLSRAPRAQGRVKSRLKVTFSDDSDLEDPKAPPSASTTRKTSCTRRKGQPPKSPGSPQMSPPGMGVRRQRGRPRKDQGSPQKAAQEKKERGTHWARGSRRKKEQEPPQNVALEEKKRGTRRAGGPRGKKEQETPQKGALEEKTKQGPPSQGVLEGLNPLRAMEEEEEEELRRSFEVSQEWGGPPGRVQPKATEDVPGRGDPPPGLGAPLPMARGHPSLDSVLELLQEALGWISHFPPGSLYGGLCQLLALLTGDRDPLGTAGLLSESLCVTARHQLLGILHSRARKKRKKEKLGGDVSEQLQSLSLREGGDPPQPCPRLAQLEGLFQFSTSGLGAPEREQFQEQIQQIPSGVTVVLLALGSPCPGAVGDTLLLTRLERDMEPLSIRIPTHRSQAPLSSILREFESIQREQKEANGCTDKQEWWSRRSRLDQRMKTLIQSLESHVLGCWRGLLLPRPPGSSPSLAEESSRLIPELRSCGWNDPNPALVQVLLNGAPALTPPDIQALAFGLCPARPLRARLLLEEALEGALERDRGDSRGSLVLLLDKHLQRLPWESLPALGAVPVTRLPALRFLLSYVMARQSSGSVLARGVNPKSTFYVLNPHNNLGGTEQRFRAWFESEPGWHGVSGSIPTPEQIQEALLEHDLYIYAGHGSGVRLLDRQTLSRLECRAVVLLFGCSSAALALRGALEPTGTVLRYVMAGCPLVLGTLWDVTDRDLDRFAHALLRGWLGGGPGTPLLPHLSQARQAPRLKSLIGAAPVAYGLPVSLS